MISRKSSPRGSSKPGHDVFASTAEGITGMSLVTSAARRCRVAASLFTAPQGSADLRGFRPMETPPGANVWKASLPSLPPKRKRSRSCALSLSEHSHAAGPSRDRRTREGPRWSHLGPSDRSSHLDRSIWLPVTRFPERVALLSSGHS